MITGLLRTAGTRGHIRRRTRLDHCTTAPCRTPHKSTGSRSGFTLVELMVVVVITGILAAIAIPSFTGYIHKSRTSEAIYFLNMIRLKQEGFMSEYARYSPGVGGPVAPGGIEFTPARASMTGGSIAFPNPMPNEFLALGIRAQQPVRFGYGWAVGTPADSAASGLTAAPYDHPAPIDHYFVAQATADLNGDGVYCLLEVTSFTRATYYTPARGWD
jgi:prepilin-type N-terminal cleavage/methylation domain-containing protein